MFDVKDVMHDTRRLTTLVVGGKTGAPLKAVAQPAADTGGGVRMLSTKMGTVRPGPAITAFLPRKTMKDVVGRADFVLLGASARMPIGATEWARGYIL